MKAKKPRKANAKTPKRQIQRPDYRSFKLSKRIKHPDAKLPNSLQLFKSSIRQLLGHKKLFLGIVLVYLLLTIILVKGLGLDNNLIELKAALEETFTGGTGKLLTGLTVFSVLVGTTGTADSEVASTYQSMLLIVVSLALIWALRQASAMNKVGVRDAFYKGMYPLIPFLLIMIVIGLQLIPLLIGSTLYGIVDANGLAVNAGEKLVWFLLLGLFAVLSLYMVSSSLFALYIVTLPDVRPMQALRSARELVRYRRWAVMRKVLFLPAILLIISVFIMVPLILFVTPIAEWMFFVLTMFSLALVHSYMYVFYRKLLPHDK